MNKTSVRVLSGLVALALSCGVIVACGGGDGSDDRDAASNGGSSSGSGGETSGSGGGAPLDQSLLSACRYYIDAQAIRKNECRGDQLAKTSDQYDSTCPDILFSEGSTRTLESTLACAETWKTFPCDDIEVGLFPDCATDGTKAEGEPCLFGIQCASAYCVGSLVDSSECGTCVAAAEIGEKCSEETPCRAYYICDGVCKLRPEPEEPTWNTEPLGAVCELGLGCAPPNLCRRPALDAGTTCRAPSTDNSACDYEPYLETLGCDFGYYCVAETSLCRHIPTDGEPCLTLPTEVSCAKSVCDTGGTCRGPREAGEPCVAAQDSSAPYCGSAMVCEEGICKTRQALGEDCAAANTVCETHTLCVEGRCAADDTLTLFTLACGE